jgi:hypothetical protein
MHCREHVQRPRLPAREHLEASRSPNTNRIRVDLSSDTVTAYVRSSRPVRRFQSSFCTAFLQERQTEV